MAYETPKIIDSRSNVVRISPPVLPEWPQTNLTASAIAAAVSLTVGDNNGFVNTGNLILGPLGQTGTEIATIAGVVTPGTSLTVSAIVFAHPINTPVRLTLWNQVEVSGADTVAGSKTVIATFAIQFDSPSTDYVVTGTTYAYYFVRFKNSASGVFSSYSDASSSAGYAPNTVRQIQNEALRMTGQEIGEIITDDFIKTEISNLENELYQLGPGKRWAHFLVDNYVLGTLAAGKTVFAMPTDIADSDTGEAIEEIHTRQISRLEKIEKSKVDEIRWNVALDTLAVQTTAGQTSITLTNVGDFADSGSVRIDSDTVSYTARNVTTNVLSGIPASGANSITTTHAAGTNVWQGGQTDMTPTFYFVRPGYIELPLPPNATYLGQNLYASYYSKPAFPDSDADTVNFPDISVYHEYLAWKIQLRLSNGLPNVSTQEFQTGFENKREKMMNRARLQDAPRFTPRRTLNRQQLGSVQWSQYIYWNIV